MIRFLLKSQEYHDFRFFYCLLELGSKEHRVSSKRVLYLARR